MILSIPLSQWVIDLGVLVGFALPFLRIEHPRHARAWLGAVCGLTLLWLILYLLMRTSGLLGPSAQDRSDRILLRGYVFSSALCSLLEEVFSLRDMRKTLRPVFLSLTLVFFLLALLGLIAGALGLF